VKKSQKIPAKLRDAEDPWKGIMSGAAGRN